MITTRTAEVRVRLRWFVANRSSLRSSNNTKTVKLRIVMDREARGKNFFRVLRPPRYINLTTDMSVKQTIFFLSLRINSGNFVLFNSLESANLRKCPFRSTLPAPLHSMCFSSSHFTINTEAACLYNCCTLTFICIIDVLWFATAFINDPLPLGRFPFLLLL